MEYTTLNNGIKMPMAGIGTFLLTPDEAEASVLSALECGYRLIDTANAYVNEKAVGRAMKKSGLPREEIFLETKLWPSFYEQPDAVEKTLERLDTDYIDLLLIHQPAGNYIAGYKQMEKAYKAGKVKAIGLSNFNQEQIQEILDMCEVKPAVLQTEVHPYFQEKELKQFLSKEGILIQSWYPLGHGDKALLEEPLFSELGRKYGKSNAQIILRWHILDGNIVIPGSKKSRPHPGQFRSVRFFSDRRGNGENRGHGQKGSLLYQHPGNAEGLCGNGARCGRSEIKNARAGRVPASSLSITEGSRFYAQKFRSKTLVLSPAGADYRHL